MLSNRERWFADVLQAGLDTRVLVEPELLVHVTPGVLAKSMPRDVLVRMFDSALSAGALSPEAILQTITPELIAEFVEASLVWESIVSAAERANIAKGTDDKNAREFVRRVIDAGLKTQVLTAVHLLQHVDAKVLVNHLPDELTAKLIEASLAAGKMSPELIVDVLGPDPVAAHAPTSVVWECVAEVGEGLLLKDGGDKKPATTTPASASSSSSSKKTTPPPVTGKPANPPTAKIPAKVDVVDISQSGKSAAAKKLVMDYMDDDMVSLQVSVDEPEPPVITSSESGPRPPVAKS